LSFDQFRRSVRSLVFANGSRLNGYTSTSPMRPSELEHDLSGDFQRFQVQKFRPVVRHTPAQNATNIDKGPTAANHADVVLAVAHHVTVRAEYGILKGDGVERSLRRKRVRNIRPVHHRPPGKRLIIADILHDIASNRVWPDRVIAFLLQTDSSGTTNRARNSSVGES
jgi:hypothetical protein